MNTRNRYLTAILLILTGILLGGVFVMLQQGQITTDRADVQFTEINTSNKALFSDTELEKLDARFLFKNVANRATPAVVYINSVITLNEDDADGGEFEDDEQSFWDRFRSSRRARTVGSGVIISEEGYIVTNNHVISGAIDGGILVRLNDKRVYDARVVGTDLTTDLAVIKVDAQNLPAMTIGNSNEVDVGEWVLAIGNPFGLRSTVTAGIVSALSRQVDISGSDNSRLRIDSYIQTDAAINKGNSGGALVSTGGELIGINTAIASKNGSYQGYGFAVPSNLVRKVVGDLIEYGEIRRAMLGVSIVPVNFARARSLGLDSVKGVEIRELTENGAANRQGLLENDVILKVNNEPVNEPNELQEKIAVLTPGEIVALTVWRNTKIIEKDIELGELESSNTALAAGKGEDDADNNSDEQFEDDSRRGIAYGRFSLGFRIMALSSPEDAEVFDLIISRVYSGTEAAQQGLKEGYIITEVNSKPVKTLEELREHITELSNQENDILLKVKTPEEAIGYYTLKTN
jgi:Do/DeqQ family serine protease